MRAMTLERVHITVNNLVVRIYAGAAMAVAMVAAAKVSRTTVSLYLCIWLCVVLGNSRPSTPARVQPGASCNVPLTL